jgi:hypothetical protein
LRGDFFAEEARNFLNSTIDNAMERPLPEVIGAIAPAQLEQLKTQISNGALSLLQGEEMLTSISAYLTDTLQKLRPHSIDAILQDAAPGIRSKAQKYAFQRFAEGFVARRNFQRHQRRSFAANRTRFGGADRQIIRLYFR